MNEGLSDALSVGTRLRGGALLIEEALRRDQHAFVYRAYDVPARREVTLQEYFPTGASREERNIAAPTGWSTQGFAMARQKFADNFNDAIFSFEENGTLYIAGEYFTQAVSTPNSGHATVLLSGTPAPPPSLPLNRAPESVSPVTDTATTVGPTLSQQSPPKQNFDWRDVLPDAGRGALQGAVAGSVGGVVLGIIAAVVTYEDVSASALRGLWGLPIGALAGGFLAMLRALPSSMPQLATASARTREDQWSSTLSGATKGALLGIVLGCCFLLPMSMLYGGEVSVTSGIKAALLSGLCGAFAGAIVGFIRVTPRDRARRH